ncbi:MAG: M48 family metalloprotease [Ketobacteraceae bacterium]|nr:M48 family metalloprotease [Ketobacteraceae bacterium]
MTQLNLGDRVWRGRLTRRDFVKLASVCTAGCAAAPVLTGCAVNPVTGERQLMLMSESQEISIDRQQSPHQFSSDYGITQDQSLNRYIGEVGNSLAARTHRPDMPYRFQAVNAVYVNAYAFPGGSIAVTRGILVSMDSEAELAALLGHELGHVNARHTAARMSKGTLLNVALAGTSMVLGDSAASGIAGQLGQLGGAALLAHYSRDDERQADALGMEYMVKGNYSPTGMVNLMEMLLNLSDHNPSTIEMMFSTHPMSRERYQNTTELAQSRWSFARDQNLGRERYMDNTARLRNMKSAIKAMETAEQHIAQQKFTEARQDINRIKKLAPNDYTGLVIRGKYHYVQSEYKEAAPVFREATNVYPEEAQAHHLLGLTHLALKNPEAALAQFNDYERLLPGNPNTVFLQGIALENMQQIENAASHYQRYLQQVNSGQQAQYAYQRLVDWGYVKPQG